MDDEKKIKRTSTPRLLGFIIPIAVIIIVIVVVSKLIASSNPASEGNTDGNPILLNRAATINDMDISFAYAFPANINCTVTPTVDIKNLEITFTFYDKNNKVLTTKTKIVGTVDKNIDYTVPFTISEFSLSHLLSLDYTSYTVSGGTVSYFSR